MSGEHPRVCPACGSRKVDASGPAPRCQACGHEGDGRPTEGPDPGAAPAEPPRGDPDGEPAGGPASQEVEILDTPPGILESQRSRAGEAPSPFWQGWKTGFKAGQIAVIVLLGLLAIGFAIAASQ